WSGRSSLVARSWPDGRPWREFGCPGCGGSSPPPGGGAPPAPGGRGAWAGRSPPGRRGGGRGRGGPAVAARAQPGACRPRAAGGVRCGDGTRCFVKAASAELNPDTPRLHRQEARVLAELDSLIAAGHLPVPRLWGTAELGPWFALVVDDVAGHQPVLPWRDGE